MKVRPPDAVKCLAPAFGERNAAFLVLTFDIESGWKACCDWCIGNELRSMFFSAGASYFAVFLSSFWRSESLLVTLWSGLLLLEPETWLKLLEVCGWRARSCRGTLGKPESDSAAGRSSRLPLALAALALCEPVVASPW